MNKKIIYILFICLLILPFNVKAEVNDSKLEQKYIGDIYAVFKMSNGQYYLYLQDLFLMNGKTAYCIEPNIHITTSIYTSTENFDILNLTQQQKDKIKLIAYYGYDYYNHKDIKYFMAAQELIWETTLDGDGDVYWTSTDKIDGPKINIEKEKEDIKLKVNKDGLLPSFDKKTFEFQKGEDKNITDDNNVIEDYEVINTKNIIKNKNLVKINDEQITEVKFKKKSYTNDVFLIYHAGKSQKFITSGKLEPKSVILNLKTYSGKIIINKFGEQIIFKDGIFLEEILLPNVEFEIIANEDIIISNKKYYSKGDLVTKAQTDINGNLIIDNMYFGKYVLKEVKSSNQHIIDNKEYPFELVYDKNNKESMIYEISIKNRLPKGEIEIVKKDMDKTKLLKNAKFAIYTIDNKFIMNISTGDSGIAKINNLPLGKYYVVELEAPEGYQLDSSKVYFEIKEDKQKIEIEVLNKKVIKVPITGKNVIKYQNISLISLLFLGVFLIIYDKKNRNYFSNL